MRVGPRFVHLTGRRRGAVDPIASDDVLLGCDGARCAVWVDPCDEPVMGVHARVFRAQGAWWLADRSGGRTAIDGRVVHGAERLEDGRVVCLGPEVRLLFRAGGASWRGVAVAPVFLAGALALGLSTVRAEQVPVPVPAAAPNHLGPARHVPDHALSEEPLRAAVRGLLTDLRGAPHTCPIPDAFLDEVRGELGALHRSPRALCTLRRWRDPIREVLRSEALRLGQPASRADALVYLAWVESGFDPAACSPAGARGTWQFVPETARRYGLRVDDRADQRCHWRDATTAALRHLGDLFDRCGADRPLLAVAGYNTGGARACRDRGSDPCASWDFRAFVVRGTLHDETTEYVPRFVAAWLVGEHPEVALAEARSRDPRAPAAPTCAGEGFVPPMPRWCATPATACPDRRHEGR